MAMASSKSINLGSRRRSLYALVQLGMPQLSLKEEQKQAIHAIYSSSDIFVRCLLNSGRVYLSKTLPFVFDFKDVC